MANLYYNAAVDTSWDTLGNWWNDSAFTDPALALPATGDTVYLAAQMDSGPSTAVTLNHIYVSVNYSPYYELDFSGAIGNATFNQGIGNSGTVTGDATYYNSYNNGTVLGNATFNDRSINIGTASGDATFNDTSYNSSTVTGNATFNDGSYIYNGTVSGNATFNDNSYIYPGSTIYGDATFNDLSFNGGTVQGTATYNSSFTGTDFNTIRDYIGGRLTTLSNGYGYWDDGNGSLYYAGYAVANGLYDDYDDGNGNKYYSWGVLGTGFYDDGNGNKYYSEGVLFTGLYDDGNGNKYYSEGVLFTGLYDGVNYVEGIGYYPSTSFPQPSQVLSGVSYGNGLTGTHTEASIPNAPQPWGNYTYYGQGDVVSEGGFLWLLVNTGGWTVGGRPSLGYGWQKLSTGGGTAAPQSINLAQLIGLPPFIQL